MTSFYLAIAILLLVAEMAILIYKTYQIAQKLNKLFNYFIRSEKDLPNGERISFSALMKGLPPTNGECPTKEELDSFK